MKYFSSKPLIAIAILASAFVTNVSATNVTFWFSGVLDTVNDISNSVPAGVSVGTPFTGQVTYNTSSVASSNVYYVQTDSRGNYYFDSTGGFSMKVYLAGHVLSNGVSEPGYPCGYVGITDGFNNEDSFVAETASSQLFLDGNVFVSAPYKSSYSLYLADATKTVYNSPALTAAIPDLAQFGKHRDFNWVCTVDGSSDTLFWMSGTVNSVTAEEQVMLTIRKHSTDTIQVAWPLDFSGYTLQWRDQLNAGTWQDVATPAVDTQLEHTVTLPATNSRMFFRLVK